MQTINVAYRLPSVPGYIAFLKLKNHLPCQNSWLHFDDFISYNKWMTSFHTTTFLYSSSFHCQLFSNVEPNIASQAKQDPNWQDVPNLEIQALEENNTWMMTSFPKSPLVANGST